MKKETCFKLINLGVRNLAKHSMEEEMKTSVELLKKTPSKGGKENIDLITQAELCKRLSVSETTLWRHRTFDRMPFVNVGRKIMYDYNQVLKFIGDKKRW